MKVLCVIPARGKSQRAPGKNIKPLSGKPLIGYTIEAALESKLVDRTVVSTDSPDIAKVAEESGAKTVVRPAELASATSPIDDALRHAVRQLERQEGFSPDIVVLLQANVPVRKKGEIDEVIKRLMETEDATAVVTVYRIDQRPEWMKILDRETGRITPYMEPTGKYRMQDLPELYLIDGAVLAVKTDVLMTTEGDRKIHAYLGGRIYAVIHDKKYSTEVDEEEDFETAEYFLLKEKSD